ncbi:MAG: molybdenum cofactor guanylyltransferase [Solirubrobacteraceae bacterium]
MILAGGRGRRIGGGKATVELGGRPLISYPLAAVRAVLTEVAILAKADTELPSLPGTPVWIEPDAPRHPLVGILYALEQTGGRPVLVCAGDLPFVMPALIARIAGTEPDGALAVLAAGAGAVQPLLGCYQPGALGALGPADGARRGVALREAVAVLAPRLLEVEDRESLFNVNSAEDLVRAEAMLAGRPGFVSTSMRPGAE